MWCVPVCVLRWRLSADGLVNDLPQPDQWQAWIRAEPLEEREGWPSVVWMADDGEVSCEEGEHEEEEVEDGEDMSAVRGGDRCTPNCAGLSTVCS